MWLATDNGLWQFDGNTSQRFANGSEKYPILKTKTSSNFYDLIKDKNGNLITSVLEGNLLIKYNPDKRKIIDTIPILTTRPNGQFRFETDSNNELYYTSINKDSHRYSLYKIGADDVERPIFEIPKVNGIDDKSVHLNIIKSHIFLLTNTALYYLDLNGKLIRKIDMTHGGPTGQVPIVMPKIIMS